jgi:steroid delta-isomerase-like uncharacterized protein
VLTAHDNATIVRSHFDCFNSRNFEKGLTLVTKDVKWSNIPFDRDFIGLSGYREFHNNWVTAMPDCKVEIVNLVSDDQSAVVEMIARGTHTGPLAGPQGTIPATQKKLNLKVCELFRLQDGLIVESRVYFDSATMLRQLGVLPTGTPAGSPVPSAR